MFVNYKEVNNEKGLKMLFDDIADSDIYAIDIESTGLEIPGPDRIIGIAFYFPKPDRSYYVPIAHGKGRFSYDSWEDVEGLRNSVHKKQRYYADMAMQEIQHEYDEVNLTEEQVDQLKQFIYYNSRTWVAHNAQFDMLALDQEGFMLPDKVIDTMVEAHVLFSDWYSCQFDIGDRREWGSKELKWLAEYFQLPNAGTTEEGLLDVVKERLDGLREYERYAFNSPKDSKGDSNYKGFLWTLLPSQVTYYAENDTRLTWHLHEHLKGILDKWSNFETADTLSLVARHALIRMTRTGFRLDIDRAKRMVVPARKEVDEIEERAKELAGDPEFNIGSHPQLKDYLKRIGVDVPNTQEATLREYYDDVEMIRLVLNHRGKSKFLSTYLEAWLDRHIDGKVHPQFNLATKTGRLSSSGRHNNFQNIPKDILSPLSPKNVLLPSDPNKCIIEADYGGQEVSVGTWIAEHLLGHPDKTLTNQVLSGDMHIYTRDKADLMNVLRGMRSPLEHLILRGEDEKKLRAMSEEELNKYWAKWCRQQAKIVNFACMYGGSGKAISEQLSIPRHIANKIYRDWTRAYPAVSDAIKTLQRQALTPRQAPNDDTSQKYLFVKYPVLNFIKKYDPYDIVAVNDDGGTWSPLQKAARDTYNHVTQGTSTMITIYSAYRISIDPRIGHLVDLHATVHDSIIMSALPEHLDLVCRVVEEIMTDFPVYPPLRVDFEVAPVGEAWGRKQAYEYAR